MFHICILFCASNGDTYLHEWNISSVIQKSIDRFPGRLPLAILTLLTSDGYQMLSTPMFFFWVSTSITLIQIQLTNLQSCGMLPIKIHGGGPWQVLWDHAALLQGRLLQPEPVLLCSLARGMSYGMLGMEEWKVVEKIPELQAKKREERFLEMTFLIIVLGLCVCMCGV